MTCTTCPALRFTLAEAEQASDAWGFNCGPGAIAAVLGLSLAELRPHLGDFEIRRYTNPTLMWTILRNLNVKFEVDFAPYRIRKHPERQWPQYGLARIQWKGPWTEPGVPPRAAYRYTHWVGAHALDRQNIGIWDVNALSEVNETGWVKLADWKSILVPFIIRQYPRANGKWHITHSVEVEKPA